MDKNDSLELLRMKRIRDGEILLRHIIKCENDEIIGSHEDRPLIDFNIEFKKWKEQETNRSNEDIILLEKL